MKVKICGITTVDDALYAAEAGADALGFNFAEEAKAKGRYIDPEAAAGIIASLPPFITTVAVCVNDPLDRMLNYLKFIDCVQLHGEEPAETCAALGHRAIKVFRIESADDIAAMQDWPAASFLVDAHVKGARGGTGTVADWSLARKAVAVGKPLILAGGLTPENVAEAVRAVRPYAVDTASGVESEPGKKDHERIKRFIDNAKTTLA